MGDTKYQELILDAIDQLRKRKARPDLERICHMLERRHGLKASDVHDELKRLVNQSIVIKVDYKGHTSYRNAAKWVRTKSQFFGFFSSADLSGNVVEAVEALNSGDQSTPNARGASIREIERYLITREAQSNINIATLRAVLEKEVANGSLIQLPSGDFLTKTSYVPQPSKPELNQSDNLKEDPGKRGRPISTRKRFKKTHGPDFLETASIVSTDSPDQPRCDYCLLTANANRTGEPEDLLVCKDCNAKAHPSCMDYTPELAARSQMSPWQCTDCKTCTICEDSGDGDSMLFCDLCDKGYHMNCHRPPVTIKPTGKWVCSYCSTDGKQELSQNSFQSVTSIDGALCLPTPCDSPVSEGTRDGSRDKNLIFVFEECLKNYPDVIPRAEKWTIEDVEKFFKCIGYRDEAPAFREQEIDGQSLLLMKRSDVLTGLAIKLGPALKIYNHIKRLQSRLPDGHLL